MQLDTVILSRIQFAFTVGFHIIFPSLNIGLAVFLSFMEGLWLKTKNPAYHKICRFWTKIFALTFGLGVVSGIVMAYQLGTNFSRFILAAGSVLGPLFAYEVLSAFFLEAGFLGVMLFGWNRVGPRLHYLATLLVTVGTIISAFWIMSANSWMQTPAGYEVINGKFQVTDWMHAIFNPSVIPRFSHMIFASLSTATFVVAGVSAWYLLKNRHLDIAKPAYSFALGAALIVAPLQIFLGDEVGLVIHEHQPLKTAAMEGNWQTQQGAPFVIFGIPDNQLEKNLYAIEIPYMASIINTHQVMGTLLGLDSAPPQDRPVVVPVFFAFRIMIAIGFLFLLVAILGLVLRIRKKLYDNRFLQRLCVFVGPLGFVATIAGWITAEMGRQPWVIYGLLRTHNAASQVPGGAVLTSLITFVTIYSIIFGFYLFYLFRFIKKGPVGIEEPTVSIVYMQRPKQEESGL